MSLYDKNIEFIKLAKNGDKEATDYLIKKNYPLAVSLAKKYMGRGTDLEDLIQLALIGMVKAIDTFDIEKGTAFSTYAVPLILGEIRKFLRDDGLIKVSRENKKNGAIILRFSENYSEKYGYSPSIEEICENTGFDKETVCEALASTRPVSSINEPICGEEGYTLENSIIDNNSSIDREFDKIALIDAINELPAISKKLILLRYFRDLSQTETAKILGMTQVKVSRTEKKIILELRKKIC